MTPTTIEKHIERARGNPSYGLHTMPKRLSHSETAVQPRSVSHCNPHCNPVPSHSALTHRLGLTRLWVARWMGGRGRVAGGRGRVSGSLDEREWELGGVAGVGGKRLCGRIGQGPTHGGYLSGASLWPIGQGLTRGGSWWSRTHRSRTERWLLVLWSRTHPYGWLPEYASAVLGSRASCAPFHRSVLSLPTPPAPVLACLPTPSSSHTRPLLPTDALCLPHMKLFHCFSPPPFGLST